MGEGLERQGPPHAGPVVNRFALAVVAMAALLAGASDVLASGLLHRICEVLR